MISAIVLSGGSGSRMKSDMPKQYLELNGKPVLYYALKAFQDSCVDEIVIVAGSNYLDFCQKEIVEKYALDKVVSIVEGGKERYHSVYEGLKAVNDKCEYVLIHDGARPLLTNEIIEKSIESVKKDKACVVGVPVKDTIKVIDELGYADATLDRATLWQVQTPQTFDYVLIDEAYKKVFDDMAQGKDVPTITDDAMIIEYASDKKVRMIHGDYRNIKVTTPEDMGVAELFLKNSKKI